MEKEKVGILTFHQALNYGAVLQAYALKEVCNEMGYETHIINYSFQGVDVAVAPVKKFLATENKKSSIVKLAREISSYVGDKKREKEFFMFRRCYLDESILCSSIEDIVALNYDIYISGSDQIWNYQITGKQFDPVFFLKFSCTAKKVIYAASSQDPPFPLDMELKLKKILDGLNGAISIREEKLRNYVFDLTGIDYPVVLDPTLLAGRNIIDRITSKKISNKSYILLYQIDSNPASDISVKTLEERFVCPVYTMTVPRLGSVHGRRGTAGPEEFLTLLKNAQFVVTNSFHGVALSLLFEKQFFVYENGGVMNRIDGLLSQVSLLDRKVRMVSDIDPLNKIEYKVVTSVLEKLRKDSRTFLEDALAGKKKDYGSEKKEIKKVMSLEEKAKSDCCGCSACADICPVQAIKMEIDSEGFLYPFVNKERCIHCGKCDRVCGFHKIDPKTLPFQLPYAFGVKHKEFTVRESSRSGAAFIGFSDVVLKQGGVVYGAALQDDFSVRHIRAISTKQRNRMKKAKYVQSSTIGIYPSVIDDLEAGLNVLFSGTPCQVAGLKAYLLEKKVDTERLVCCDMVCHGVPSPDIWKQYLKYISEKNHGKILEANFRDKDFGWDSHFETFVIEGKKKKVVARDYTDLFYQHIMFRPSCYNCPFANVYRPGDLTMADFWGIEKQGHLEFEDNHGVSLVLVNTLRGKEIFDLAKEEFEWFETSVENCMQPTLVKPSVPSPRRDIFWRDYEKMSFYELLKKYTTPSSFVEREKKRLKKIMYRMGIKQHP